MKRREFLSSVAAPLAMMPLASTLSALPVQTTPAASKPVRLKQSVMSSVWGNSTPMFEDKCKVLARIGFKGIDLPTAAQIPIMKQYGLSPTMMTGTGTTMQNGFIRKELHDAQEAPCRAGIDACVAAGCANLIGFAGEKRGMSPAEAADNTVAIFSRLKDYAEQKNVNICLEMTNSKVVADARTDMAFDRLAWGLGVCKRVQSPRFKILYDMYHVQIMEGDLTRNMLDNLSYICH